MLIVTYTAYHSTLCWNRSTSLETTPIFFHPSQGVEREGRIVTAVGWERLSTELVCPRLIVFAAFPCIGSPGSTSLRVEKGIYGTVVSSFLSFLVVCHGTNWNWWGKTWENIPTPKTPVVCQNFWEVPKRAKDHPVGRMTHPRAETIGLVGMEKRWCRSSLCQWLMGPCEWKWAQGPRNERRGVSPWWQSNRPSSNSETSATTRWIALTIRPSTVRKQGTRNLPFNSDLTRPWMSPSIVKVVERT